MISWDGPFESNDALKMRLESITKLLRRCTQIKVMELSMLFCNQEAKMAVEALKNLRKSTMIKVDQLVFNKIMFNNDNTWVF